MLFSEKQRNDIYEDVKDIIANAEDKARKIIQKHSAAIKSRAVCLMNHKSTPAEESKEIMTS